MKKKLLCTFLAMIVVSTAFMFVGCTPKKNEIIFTHWANSVPHERAFEQIASKYNAQNKDYTVKVVKRQADGYRTWLITQLSTGKAPDIVQTKMSWADMDAKNNYISDLTPALSDTNPYTNTKWKDEFIETYLKTVENKFMPGVYNLIPTTTVAVRMFINKDMFAKHSIELPQETWNWEQFISICTQFKNKGIIPLNVANKQMSDYLISWVTDILYAQILDTEINEWDVDDSNTIETTEIVKAVKEGKIDWSKPKFKEGFRIIEQWKSLWQNGPNGTQTSTCFDEFVKQKSPMFYNGSWSLKGLEMTLQNENPEVSDKYEMFDYTALPLPKLTSQSSQYIDEPNSQYELGNAGFIFAVPKITEKRGTNNSAIDFLRFLTAKENAQILADAAYDIPVIKGVKVNDSLANFLIKPDSKIVKMRFSGQLLGDGNVEDYAFKQMQLFVGGDLSLDNLTKNLNSKYNSKCNELAEENGWNEANNWGIALNV